VLVGLAVGALWGGRRWLRGTGRQG
jgi:hypothetical protein